mmetsp:Transcript_72817/g.170537  ORF Transcript_72817/g.170537 Transcript_72817/m.170537 type:complete len:190 (-) Transcript_72817:197-766(-)
MPKSDRCEYVAGTSCKFWECVVSGSSTCVTYGKIGGAYSTSDKTHASPAAATLFAAKMLESKLKGGYVRTGPAKMGKLTAKPSGARAPAAAMKAAAKPAAKPKPVMKVAMKGGKKLTGKTICFTGALATMTRAVARAEATSAGAKVTSGVSKNTEILVVGNDAGSKILKGSEGMEYWTESQFRKAVGLK